jgi:hypothetical protein
VSFVGSLIRMFVERKASKTSLDEIRKGIETSGKDIAARIAGAVDSPANRMQAGHVIGMERWALQRLRSALSPATPPVMDEYDGYRPSADLSMDVLAGEFSTARADTLVLLEDLRDLQDCHVLHNDLGSLSVRGWLLYLDQHASLESKKIK